MEIYNHNPIIYIVCGKARHGKDTVAGMIREICEEKGLKTINLQYSSYIKEYAKKFLIGMVVKKQNHVNYYKN